MRERASEIRQSVGDVLTDEFLKGSVSVDLSPHIEPSPDVEIDRALLRSLFDRALESFDARDERMDAWLAPRLHCASRLTRRSASSKGFWRWLSLEVAPDYVRHRWKEGGVVKAYRFLGGGQFLRRNALARLWWGAEAARNGERYHRVEAVFSSSGLEQYLLDSYFGQYPPAAQGFLRSVLDDSGRSTLTFDQLKALAKRANLLLAASTLEGIGADEFAQALIDDTPWMQEEPDTELIVRGSIDELRGPPSRFVPPEIVERYAEWFRELIRMQDGPSAVREASAP